MFSSNVGAILTSWREASGAKLWRFSLNPHNNLLPPTKLDTQEDMLSTFSFYYLPSVEHLVHYIHTAAGFPVKVTWIAAIRADNYATNDCGLFLVRARSGNHYIIIAFHCDTNIILNPPFKTTGNTQRIAA